MNLDTYDLPEEDFKHLFQGKTDLLCQLLRQHVITLIAFEFTGYLKDPKFVWDSFQEALYAASEDARVIQKEKDPLARLKQSPLIGSFQGETDLSEKSEEIVHNLMSKDQ
jgi:hypothetical protein